MRLHKVNAQRSLIFPFEMQKSVNSWMCAIVLTTIFLIGPFVSAACITALALRPFSCQVNTSFVQKTACMISGGPAVDHWTTAYFSLPTHLQNKVSFLHSTFLSTPLRSGILQHFQIRFGESKIMMQTYCICTNRIFDIHTCNFSSLEFSSIISRPSAANATFFCCTFFFFFLLSVSARPPRRSLCPSIFQWLLVYLKHLVLYLPPTSEAHRFDNVQGVSGSFTASYQT